MTKRYRDFGFLCLKPLEEPKKPTSSLLIEIEKEVVKMDSSTHITNLGGNLMIFKMARKNFQSSESYAFKRSTLMVYFFYF